MIGKNNRLRLFVIVAAATAASAPIVATLFSGIFDLGAGAYLFSPTGLRYISGTLTLVLSVAIGVTIIGAGTAALVAMTDFPGRRVFSIALAMPFAIPAYVAAYVYGDFFGPFGPVSQLVGASNSPTIRSLPGAAIILTLMTYPYVYLAMRASLASRSSAYIEAARMLGAGPIRAARLLVAIGRPALAGGLALALMETAADYGVADYFGVPTLSVGIFRTWQGLGDLVGATQLALALFFVALLFVLIEEIGRRGENSENAKAHRDKSRIKLNVAHSTIAIIFVTIPVALGFVIPILVLATKLGPELTSSAARGLSTAFANSAAIASGGAAAAIILALLLAYAGRYTHARVAKLLIRIATLGYAIPGAVIAIGILAIASAVTQTTGVLVTGGISILLYAYITRFLTAGYNVCAGGLQQISPQMDAAAQTLGASPARIVSNVHWPQARGAVLAGAAIIAIDIAKELPATLLLRPFNFETLSTRVYRLAADERLAEAAPAALLLIVLGILPTLLLTMLTSNKNARTKTVRA